MAVKYRKANAYLTLFALPSLVFLLICSFFWNDLPMSESLHFWDESQTFSQTISNVWHPPIYILALHFFHKLFLGKALGGYVLGILSALLSSWLICAIIYEDKKELIKHPRTMWIIQIGYLSLPLIIHGSFIFDIDNTILTPIILLTYLFSIRFRKEQKWKQAILLLLTCTISLWCKMTTPLILMCSICLYYVIKQDFKFLFLKLIPVFSGSVLLFYFSYGFLFTKYVLDGYGSFQFNRGKAGVYLSGFNTFQLSIRELFFSIGSNVGALVIWSSTLLLLMCFYLIISNWGIGLKISPKWLKKELSHNNIIPLIYICAMIFCYSFLLKVQSSAGYPKYHYPSFSFLFIILGNFLFGKKHDLTRFDFIFCFFTLGFYLYLLSDDLYVFYSLGRARQFPQLIVYFSKTTVITLVPVLSYFIIRKFSYRRLQINVTGSLFIFLILVNFSGFVFRAQSNYSTNYHYGIRGTMEAMNYANSLPLENSILFPFTGYFLNKHPEYPRHVFGRVMNTNPLKPDTDFLIISDHLLNSNKFFFGINFVEKKYKKIKTIESYGVWQKKKTY